MRTHWRDCKAWIDDGLPITTTNEQCCKLFDAAVTQACGFYNDSSLGGLEKTMKDMMAADPEFLMGQVFVNGLRADSERLLGNTDLQNSIKKMIELADKQNVTERERKHVNAVKLLSEGERLKAMDVWEDILIDHPTDQLACRCAAFMCGFELGLPERYRDLVSRAISAYKRTTPGYSNLLSWQAFGFEETNIFDKGEKLAKLVNQGKFFSFKSKKERSLEIEPRETWASHTLSHVYEMQGRSIEGADFMTNTVKDWSSCQMLACHNYWHTALFHVDQGRFDDALSILDNEIMSRARTSGTMFSLLDSSSLLYRLEFEGVKVKERWNEIVELSRKHVGNINWIFNDAHLMMIACRGKQEVLADNILRGLREFAENCTGDSVIVTKNVGITLCEAIQAYENKNFDKATELLTSVRYDIIKLGGSNAQRDVFSQLLIHSALQSAKEENQKFGRLLLKERRAMKEKDALTDRLMAQVIQMHAS